MRLVVELKRDAVPQIVLNKLFKLTPMQSSFGVINLAIVNGQPRVLTLKQILLQYLNWRHQVLTRRTQFELDKARARAHVLEGLIIDLDHWRHFYLLMALVWGLMLSGAPRAVAQASKVVKEAADRQRQEQRQPAPQPAAANQ